MVSVSRMAKKEHISETPATQLLRKQQVAFSEHPYDYEEHGGTSVSARALGVDEHHVVKTLVMQDETAKPLMVLMHGDCKVSTKNLARAIGSTDLQPMARARFLVETLQSPRWRSATAAIWSAARR